MANSAIQVMTIWLSDYFWPFEYRASLLFSSPQYLEDSDIQVSSFQNPNVQYYLNQSQF